MNSSAAGLLLLWCMALGQYSEEEVREVEAQILANRLAIKKWHVRVSLSYGGTDDSSGKPVEITYYVDGDRLRQDKKYRYIEKVPDVNEDYFTKIRVWGDKDRLAYGTHRNANGGKDFLAVTRRDIAMSQLLRGKIPIRDIRPVGCHPQGFLEDTDMTAIFEHPDISERRMVDEDFNGIPCRRIDWVAIHDTKKTRVIAWVAPHMGHSVLRMEVANELYPSMAMFTDLVVEEYRDTGIWFPTSSLHEHHEDGELKYREEATIEVMSLNEPLAPEFFTIAGLNVPMGSRVIRVPNPTNANLFWDGEKIYEQGFREAMEALESEESSRRVWLLSVSFALCAVCVVCLWKYLASRHV